MTVFLVVAALFVTGALLFVLPPLLRPATARASPSKQAENVRLYREELANLDRELAGGAITESQHLEAKREIERRLIEDVGEPGGAVSAPAAAPRWMPIAVGAAIPLIAGSVYLWVGNPQGLDPQAAVAPDAGHSVTPEQIAQMVERLAEKLKQTPDDVQGWVMLARSYAAIERYKQAADATHVGCWCRRIGHPRRLSRSRWRAAARCRASLRDHQARTQGDPACQSLALAGSAEFERKSYASAIGYWERIVLVGADSDLGVRPASIEEARNLGKLPPGSIAKTPAPEAKERAAASASSAPAALHPVRLLRPNHVLRRRPPRPTAAPSPSLAPALAKQVFRRRGIIFARPAEGARMPLAIVRESGTCRIRSVSMTVRRCRRMRACHRSRASWSARGFPNPAMRLRSPVISLATAMPSPECERLSIVIDQVN